MFKCDECFQEYPDEDERDCPCQGLAHIFDAVPVVTRDGIRTQKSIHQKTYKCCKFCNPIKHNHRPDEAWL